MRERNEIPPEKLFAVTNDTKKIDFSRPYKYIYFDWWFNLLTLPVILLLYPVAALAGVYFGLRVSGRENKRILGKRGCIVISNHCHYFDTVFASKAVFPRRLYISVAQRNFEVPVVRRILRTVRAFPIPARAMGFRTVAAPVGEALRRGHHVLVLPEGDLVYLSQEIYRFKPGAFYMSCLHQAPILPMVYVFTKRSPQGRLRAHAPSAHAAGVWRAPVSAAHVRRRLLSQGEAEGDDGASRLLDGGHHSSRTLVGRSEAGEDIFEDCFVLPPGIDGRLERHNV